MSDNYAIEIALDDDTLKKLNQTGQSLRAYKSVKASIEGGLCPVWFTTTNLSKTVDVKWTEQYGAYIDNQELKPNIVIDAENIEDVDLGDLMTVQDDGTAVVTSNGRKGDVAIKNGGKKEWTCGMSQVVNGKLATLCAFPLFGNFNVLMMPYEQVLLVFESGETDTGTVVEETISSSIILTLTGDDVGKTKNVSFSIDNGWDAQGANWAKISTDTINLADTLIHKM
ncbi:MAG: hypothetical protein ABWZ66_07105 [Pyrinomonadaceae bacterium]